MVQFGTLGLVWPSTNLVGFFLYVHHVAHPWVPCSSAPSSLVGPWVVEGGSMVAWEVQAVASPLGGGAAR